MQVTLSVDIPHLGDRIKAAVEASGKSPTVVAAMAEMSVANLYRIMSEETKSIPRDTLKRLSVVLRIDFDADVRAAILSEIDSESP
ncbi:MAG: helix-turn-helix domain-containing protein [Leptolyngbyaceae cyanobacterium SL_7_1]|nr:helix-turn-helix domain-containing protein [Leptolyngbyaceae cyanobacterium SL_7_1]